MADHGSAGLVIGIRKGNTIGSKKGNTGRVGSGLFSLPGILVFLRLHRLPESITFAVHLENVALVREPVEQRRGHAFALEDLTPFAERQVARDQQTSPLVAVREDLEESSAPARLNDR